MIEPQVGKMKTGLTTGGFTVIIPLINESLIHWLFNGQVLGDHTYVAISILKGIKKKIKWITKKMKVIRY